MANKSPKQIVDEVEAALKDSKACPYCGLFDGTHQVTCEYLKHKGNVDAERAEKVSSKTATKEVSKEADENTEAKETEITLTETEQKELLNKMKSKK